jgi:hypothetical protein
MWGELSYGVDTPNPENSMIASILPKPCLAGIVYNLNKYRQIDCAYLDCLKTTSTSGQNVGICSEIRTAAICDGVAGEVMELPGIRIVKNFAQNANFVIQNAAPVVLRNIFASKLNEWCKDAKEQTSTSDKNVWLCHVPKTISQLIDANSVTRKSTHFTYPKLPDICPMALCNGEDCGRPIDPSLLEKMYIPDKRFDDDPFAAKEYNLQKRRALEDLGWKDIEIAEYKKQSIGDIDSADAAVEDAINTFKENNPVGDPYVDTEVRFALEQLDKLKSAQETKLSELEKDRKKLVDGALEPGLTSEQTTVAGKFEAYYGLLTLKEREALGITERSGANLPIVSQDQADNVNSWLEAAKDYENLLDAKSKSMTDTENIKKQETAIKEERGAEDGKRVFDSAIGAATKRTQESQKAIQDFIIEGYNKGYISRDQLDAILSEARTKDEYYEAQISTDGQKLEKLTITDVDLSKSETLRTIIGRTPEGKCDVKTYPNSQCARIKKYENVQRQQRLGAAIDFGVRYAFEKLNLQKFLQTSFFWKGGSAAVDRYLNSDSWKNSLCNPNSAINPLSESQAGTAFVLTDYGYKPVLSFAVQRQKYNDSQYLYTFALYTGGISRGEGTLQNEENKYAFDITFKGDVTKTPAHKQLEDGEIFSYAKAFLSTHKYTKMCIKFNHVFPPDNMNNNAEYCRDIVEASAWNLGNPVARDASGRPIVTPEEQPFWNGDT